MLDLLIKDARQIGTQAVGIQHAEWGGYYVTILGGRVSQIFETESEAQGKADEFIAQIAN